jgi:uncharacterized membrane protein
MSKERLAAFSDGVIAIIITIMVLELKVPHGADWTALAKLAPVFLSYALSFLYIAIYWHNHHHLIHATKAVNGRILWSNTHLLFWLSLIPFTTGWMGENHFAPKPVALYGASLLMPAIAYYILQHTIERHGHLEPRVGAAMGADWKGRLSVAAYLAGIALTPVWASLSIAIYAAFAIVWLVPDRRIKYALRGE